MQWLVNYQSKTTKYLHGFEIKQGYKLQYLFAIILVGFIMRLQFLENVRDVWHDEAFQWIFSQKSIGFILAGNDVHPPIFNLIAKVFLYVSTNIEFLRYLMVFISLYFLYYAFLMILKVFDEKTAYYGTAMLALAPTFIYYSTEFRVYMFALTVIVCQILAFNVMLKDHSLKNRAVYIGLSLLAMYSHYLTGLIVFCQVLYLFFFPTVVSNDLWSMVRQYWLKVFLPMFIGLLPLFYYLSLMLPKVQTFWFKNIGFHSLVSTFAYYVSPPLLIPTGVVFFTYVGLVVGLVYFRKILKAEHIQFLFYLVIPPFTMLIISMTSIPFFHPRYFIFSGIALFALLAWAVSKWDDIEPEVGWCMILFYFYLSYSAVGAMAQENNVELLDSVYYIEGYNHLNNITNFTTIHTSQFSGTPYHVYFPNQTHYLLTNLTKRERFTAGGSAILDEEVITNLSIVKTINETVFFLTDKVMPYELINIRGLHISRLK